MSEVENEGWYGIDFDETDENEVSAQDDADGAPCRHCGHAILQHNDQLTGCEAELQEDDEYTVPCGCPGYEGEE